MNYLYNIKTDQYHLVPHNIQIYGKSAHTLAQVLWTMSCDPLLGPATSVLVYNPTAINITDSFAYCS